jgi:hypothetical protein
MYLIDCYCLPLKCTLSWYSCFTSAWKAHSQGHAQLRSRSSTLAPIPLTDVVEPMTPSTSHIDADAAVTAAVLVAGAEPALTARVGVGKPTVAKAGAGAGAGATGSMGATAQLCSAMSEAAGWEPISSEREYVPCAQDVGCRLYIEVTAVALADGKVLAGPIALCTDVVLQAPTAPPKRVS